ncbi:MAG: glycosyl hydrolase family 28 protein [Lactobacillus sp.]|nr:glycosyl hydrolase family 28 protein [Lactobacillus sp.]
MPNTNYQPRDLTIAPASLAATHLTLIWQKPTTNPKIAGYIVYQNKQEIGRQNGPGKTHYMVLNLRPETMYHFEIVTILKDKTYSNAARITVQTPKAGQLHDVTKAPYFADPTGQQLATSQLQQAINDCQRNDTVLIPKDATLLSGALDLKSDMTLQIDGILKGSLNPEDYTVLPQYRTTYVGKVNEAGLILTRYEGWEMYCYRSLINGGYLDPTDRLKVTCQNIRICGTGRIIGGGNPLGTAMKQIYADKIRYPKYVSDGIGGRRVRGRLLSFIQCANLELTQISVENPPCWTIHMIYCDTVTTNGIHIQSQGIDNGDGWDPDSSRNMLIFDTTFDTGDDCIAIKSGKNPEGNAIAIPSENIRIFDLNMLGGHGMAIGSEESGGVSNVTIQDCQIQNTTYGLELKAAASRGGYIQHIMVQDCTADHLTVRSVDYNDDGSAAPTLPYLQDITIRHTTFNGSGPAIQLSGFTNANQPEDHTHYVRSVKLQAITLDLTKGNTGEIHLKACADLQFEAIHTNSSQAPIYQVDPNTVFHLTVDNVKKA